VVVIGSIVLVVLIVGAVIMFGGGSNNKSASDTPTPAASNNSASSDKLEVTDVKVGTGAEAQTGNTLSVSYVGTLTNGTVFDSTAKDGGQPFSFKLGAGQVIKGWDEGLVGMKVGGERKIVIPPALGYGSQATGSIPANSTLIFDVTLLGVQ
jgi:FKBP-type peptidyl-prolyl cis-trans isomerase